MCTRTNHARDRDSAYQRFSINAGARREARRRINVFVVARRATSFENSLATPLLFALRLSLSLPRGILLSSHTLVCHGYTSCSPLLATRLSSLSVAPTRFLIFRSLRSLGRSVPRVVSLSHPLHSFARSLTRALAIPQADGTAGMPNVGLWVQLCVCTRACAATETARVKVAESAGQHESTGNVSRELGVGVTAASV